MSFGYKQLLHEPIMGGGLWTAVSLTLVFEWGWKPVFLLSLTILLCWSVCAYFIARGAKKDAGS
jgi:ESS family glutamate:Na+ symporter